MRSLSAKLILAFLIVSLAGVLLVAVLGGRATAGEFGHFMLRQDQEVLVETLSLYYQEQGSWEGVGVLLRAHMGRGHGQMHGMGVGAPHMVDAALADASGRVIVPGAGYRAGAQLPLAVLRQGVPIEVNGRQVGTLLGDQAVPIMMRTAAAEFLQRVNRALILASVGAAFLALFLGAVLARALTRPLRELTAATRAVAGGDFGRHVPVRSQDELGQLAEAFNQMSAGLSHGRELRRQMTADIAHELRTPLSVILGHAEALRDGVLPPDAATFEIVHEEALRLNRLVDDLRTLSLAEAGELALTRRPTSPARLLEQVAAAQGPRAAQQTILLQTEVAPDLPAVAMDPDRMAQVLGNLLDNALRHTPSGGQVTLGAEANNGAVLFRVSDSGAGIDPDDLPHVFDRFYRADKSRRRGGSGLGLAIARSIVEAHHGRIWVESPPGEGARFFVQLP
jgi:two-component system, OmpR family, sensor histidine kinase BaeS